MFLHSGLFALIISTLTPEVQRVSRSDQDLGRGQFFRRHSLRCIAAMRNGPCVVDEHHIVYFISSPEISQRMIPAAFDSSTAT
jgi:hypothetical protein